MRVSPAALREFCVRSDHLVQTMLEKVRSSRRIALAALAVAIAACGPTFDADPQNEPRAPATLEVITSGGFATAYDLIAPRFEAETGIGLETSRGASSGGADDSIPVRLERGETFDVIILSRPALDRLAEAGFVLAGTDTDLVRSSIGYPSRMTVSRWTPS